MWTPESMDVRPLKLLVGSNGFAAAHAITAVYGLGTQRERMAVAGQLAVTVPTASGCTWTRAGQPTQA